MKIKKILSVLLSILLIFSFCSFSTYAASDGTEDIIASDMDLSVTIRTGGVDTDYTSSCTSGIWNTTSSFEKFLGYHYVIVPNLSIEGWKANYVLLTEDLKLTSEHEYELSFSYGFSSTVRTSFYVYLMYYDSQGAVIDSSLLYSNSPSSTDPISVDFSFKVDASDIKSGYSCKLMFNFLSETASTTGSQRYFISEEIGFIDKDDDSGWFQKILNAITSIPEKISSFFSELKNGITELGNNIKGFFTDLGNNIGGFFTELGENIKGFFEMLKNYLLYFQHPVTLNSEGVLVDENGKPIYTNPFESAISDIEETFDGWINDIKSFIKSMDTSRIEVSGYIETGTGFINDIMAAHPILSACLLFAAAFFVIRKVVGR